MPANNKYGGQVPRWANGGLARQIFTWHQIHLIETVPNGVWSRHFSKYPHNCLGGVMIGSQFIMLVPESVDVICIYIDDS